VSNVRCKNRERDIFEDLEIDGENPSKKAHSKCFSFGKGRSCMCMYNLCMILKTMLTKSCQNLRTDDWLVYGEN